MRSFCPSGIWGGRARFLAVSRVWFGAGDDAVVVVLVEWDDAGGAEVGLCGFASGLRHCLKSGLIAEQIDRGGSHGVDVADVEEQAVVFILDEFGDTADASGDAGHAAGHGFERGETEGLHLAG